MRFKAKISGVQKEVVGLERFQIINEFEPITTFSKSTIFISPLPTKEARITVCNETITSGTRYTLDKIYNDNGKKLWQITINGKPNCIAFIRLDWFNKIKCNLLHRRYLFQRETDWFWKAVITAAIALLFGIIGREIGYNQGYKAGKTESQSTIPK